MKKLSLLISLLCLTNAFAKVTVKETKSLLSYKFEIESMSFNKTKAGQEVNLEGVHGYEAVLSEPGKALLPVIRFYALANSASDINVQFISKKSNLESVSEIAPAQHSRVKLPNQVQKFARNKSAYSSNKFYPSVNYSVEKAGSVKGQKQFLVTLYPVQYNAALSSIRSTNQFEVSVVKNEALNKNSRQKSFAFIIGKQFEGSASIATYKEYKESLGFNVREVIVTSSMTPTAIREKVQALYNDANYNLQYALIFGDNEHVPGKDADHISGVTDHYYRAIDTNNYESDINSPDIGVGRVTIKSEKELEVVIAKFMKYSKGNFRNINWLSKAAFLATNDRYTVAEGSHNYVIDTYTAGKQYAGMFPQADQVGGDKLYAITNRASHQNVIDMFNLGRTIINYSGHGATTYWDSPRFTQDDVRNISAGNALPFVISNSCITGEFTARESFGETWIKAKNGAIMFWGSMDSTYWDEDDILERRMYDGLFTLNKRTFAEITQHALKEHWKHYGGNGKSKYYWETYVTFGDPSIKLKHK